MLVKNAMTSDVFQISLESSISDLIKILSQRGVGSVIVVNENQNPIQIITLRDIPKIYSHNLKDEKIQTFLEFLNKTEQNLLTIKSNQSLILAMNLMNKHNISHLPVVNKDRKLVGILSMRDLLRHFPYVVFTDSLTKVNNRMYLDIIKSKLENSKTKKGILMIDIDNFKNINDKYGHLVGDLVLKKIAKSIKFSIKGYDELIRYGGEEFLAILYRCDEKNLPIIAERIRIKIKEIRFKKLTDLFISVSIGGYVMDLKDSLYESIKRADEAMYEAKQSGKDCFILWKQTTQ